MNILMKALGPNISPTLHYSPIKCIKTFTFCEQGVHRLTFERLNTAPGSLEESRERESAVKRAKLSVKDKFADFLSQPGSPKGGKDPQFFKVFKDFRFSKSQF